ncbi:MAG: DUF2202 domain-containing protein [Pleomorphochaeta sp.]
MNKKILVSLVLISLVASAVLFAQGTKEISTTTSPVANEVLSQIEDNTSSTLLGASAAKAGEYFTLEEMLKYALEDEKLALAEYAFIMDEFNVSRPFSNIIKAEQSHQNAILYLYDVYGFEIEEFDASEHVVLPNSLAEIYDVGVEAEIANIAMYDKFLATEDLPDDVRRVFEALKNGSISHLQAFERQASKY